MHRDTALVEDGSAGVERTRALEQAVLRECLDTIARANQPVWQGHTPGGEPVRLVLDEIAHRFRAGSRIRVLVAGGSHPRFTRNLGTGENQGNGHQMRPATHTIHHGGSSRLTLPLGTPSAHQPPDPIGDPGQRG